MRAMKSKFMRTSRSMPGLNLASMPDLIFTVLFFFMLVTHMRDDNLKVKYEVPAGTEVRKLEQKTAVCLSLFRTEDPRAATADALGSEHA